MLLSVLLTAQAQSGYSLKIIPVDKDSSYLAQQVQPRDTFSNELSCLQYIRGLPGELYKKGFLTASVDSVASDSAAATVWLFLGESYRWASLENGNVPENILDASGYNEKFFQHHLFSYEQVALLFEKILDYCDNNGYPFAQVRLDSITIRQGTVQGSIFLDQGYIFRIDTLVQRGTAKIADSYIEHYLGIKKGSPYNESKLARINGQIAALPFLQQGQPWDINFTGDQTRLNLYLDPKKSNQFDFLVGLLPNNVQTGKLLLTGEATLHLVNSFGHGEGIDVNWQQLQYKSPQLHLAFQYPYLFNSPFGISVQFDLFRKDSSYLNIDAVAGLQYQLSSTDYVKVMLQQHRSTLLTVDTATIKYTHQLPDNVDIAQTMAGFEYTTDRTDYRLNPRKGYQLSLSISGGSKKIIRNNTILQLQDDGTAFKYASLYDSLQLHSYKARLQFSGAKYFPSGKAGTLKLGINTGIIAGQDIFLNELFRIGGYELLRGFDEQSIYASQYAVLTLEYRYLLAQYSYLFLFSDNAYVREKYQYGSSRDYPTGLGAGLAFQTKAGIFNISYAVGRRNNNAFNLRQSKIHFGYLNYF